LAVAGFALDGKKWDGIYLGRRKGKELIYAGKRRPRLRHRINQGFASAAQAAHPENAAL
jgi:hypothetical protein